ncbi:MAG: response regulator transcription factor [Kiritimatiellae bacterium]|nr:response regulator transcription factor [Kiritimatiellia bacterium]
MIKLMIVDDHAMFRDGLRSQIQTCDDIKLIGEADSAAQMLAQLATLRPDVIILDIKLPDGSGTSLIPIIKAKHTYCRVIILTMYDHVRYAAHALDQGADGFVLKGAPFEELKAAVLSVAAGKIFISQEMAGKLVVHTLHGKHGNTPLDTLSKREFEVLTHLGRGMSVKKTADVLKLSVKTISTYKQRLMQKLNLHNQAEFMRFAIDSELE